jgi:twitching motility protein PilU
MALVKYLQVLAKHDGSDLYLSTGAVPSAKFQGTLKPLGKEALKPGQIEKLLLDVLDDEQKQEFSEEMELNIAISAPGGGRFRINAFRQRTEVSIVARNIVAEIPAFDKLGLPEVLKEVIAEKRGLILFVGGTGEGKSTSLASLIDYRNSHSTGHIITIEDPIEYVHTHKNCIITQREVGADTKSFQAALKNTVSQAPDVSLIGEIRDRETMEHALAFAETGHLAISTLHANNANQAIDRIINFFPEERRPQLLQDLGLNMRAIISQRLIPTIDNKRVAAVEVLLGNKTIEDLISKGDTGGIKEIMTKSENLGMQTFDAALFRLHQAKRISLDEAVKNADSANNLRLRIKLDESTDGESETGSGMGLTLEKTEAENFAEVARKKEDAELAALRAVTA